MRLEYLLAGLLMLSGLLLAYQVMKPADSLHGKTAMSQLPLGGDFDYLGDKGAAKLSDLKGNWVLLYFGYTACPDVCPTSMGLLSGLFSRFNAQESANTRGLFISVDPERDTPQKMTAYAQFFSPNILGGTGTRTQIDTAVRAYGAAYARVELQESALGYAMDHTSFIYVIDPEGRLRSSFIHGTSVEAMLEKLRAYPDFPTSKDPSK
jgi:protein SCO1/2